MKTIIMYIAIAVVIFGLTIWWQIYRYQDCKKVGHSTFYCVMNIGK